MRELSHYHCEHTPGYRRWLQANGLDAAALDGLDDWSRRRRCSPTTSSANWW